MTTQPQGRPPLDLAEVISRYERLSAVEADVLLKAVAKLPNQWHSKDLFRLSVEPMQFLLRVGSDTEPHYEPDPWLRRQARKLLVRNYLSLVVKEGLILACAPEFVQMLTEEVIPFFADPCFGSDYCWGIQDTVQDIEVMVQFLRILWMEANSSDDRFSNMGFRKQLVRVLAHFGQHDLFVVNNKWFEQDFSTLLEVLTEQLEADSFFDTISHQTRDAEWITVVCGYVIVQSDGQPLNRYRPLAETIIQLLAARAYQHKRGTDSFLGS